MTDRSLRSFALHRSRLSRWALRWPVLGDWARRFTLKQISTLMGVLGVTSILAVTVLVGLRERAVLFQEAHDHAEQSAAFLADHAGRLFEVSDLVLHAAEASVGTQDWDAIERSPEVSANLHRLDDMLPYVDAVFLADAAGLVRATTLPVKPPGYSVAERSVFRQALTGNMDLLVGEPILGKVSHRPTFLIARRQPFDAAAPFNGLAGVAMSLGYFTDYWRTLDKRNDEQIALVRQGTGSVLVQFPESDASGNLLARAGLLAAIGPGGSRGGSFVPGPHQAGVFRQVGTLPVYITVAFRDQVITAEWHAALWQMLPAAGVAATAFLCVMALAHRLARREQTATRQIETARAVLSAANTRLEQRVAERTAELVETNGEIQRFAYIVSHDLRAPLVNIMGFTSELQGLRPELLGDKPADAADRARLGADFDEAVGFIQSSIDKMDRLIKAILTLSRQGQRPFRPESLDMGALLSSVADNMAHQIQQTRTVLTVSPLPAIAADRIAVEQVFANLLDNALKYLRPGVPGVITVEGRVVDGAAVFTVSDNGRGIAPQDRERVFELFRRAGPQDRPGEGIGLAHVRSLVRRLQGTITLDSAPGLGCVFTVALPIQAEHTGTGRAEHG